MDIAYISENKIYRLNDGNKIEIPCERIAKYKETLASIRRRSEWKSSGQGAKFMGVAQDVGNDGNIHSSIKGICENNGKLIYTIALDETESLYERSYDRTDTNEGLIIAGNDLYFGSSDCKDGKMAVSLGHNSSELHISVLTPPSAAYTEYTDGDTIEENPSWSKSLNRIYFSTAGYARYENGSIAAVSPRSAAYFDIDKNELVEFISDNSYDFLKISDDSYGNIYYIRQPYAAKEEKSDFAISDIFLFPFRLIKGLFGWFNFMCTIWGGESLKKGDAALPGMTKSKNRSQKDIIIEGNIIKAETLAKESKLDDNDLSGFLPQNRVLIKREADDNEIIIAKGVLDYAVSDNGTVIYSNGRHIMKYENGTESHIAKARLATSLTICK